MDHQTNTHRTDSGDRVPASDRPQGPAFPSLDECPLDPATGLRVCLWCGGLIRRKEAKGVTCGNICRKQYTAWYKAQEDEVWNKVKAKKRTSGRKLQGSTRKCQRCGRNPYPNMIYCRHCHGIMSSTYEEG